MAVTVLMGEGQIRALRIAGAVLGLGSLPLIFLPIVGLKRYGGVAEGKSYMATTQVVDRGILGVVRHPQYLGYLAMGACFALLSQRWYAVALALGGGVFFVLHTLREERILLERFGDSYRDYMGKVPRFNIFLGIVRRVLGRRG
jgi:protein-S-isoprenylcysteine O-methyltransferase Ste14